MADHNSQQKNNPYVSIHIRNSLTPSSTTRINSQQQQQSIHVNNNIGVLSSQPTSLVSSGSSSSIGSTSSDVRTEDRLFDKIISIFGKGISTNKFFAKIWIVSTINNKFCHFN